MEGVQPRIGGSTSMIWGWSVMPGMVPSLRANFVVCFDGMWCDQSCSLSGVF